MSDHQPARPCGKKPRGVMNVSDRMRAAVAQVRTGRTRADVAQEFGVSKGAVDNWCTRVREAEEDERHRT